MSTDIASLPRATSRWLVHTRQDGKTLATPDYATLEDRELATLAARGQELAFRELQLEIEAAEAKFNEKLRIAVTEFGRGGAFTVILDSGAVAWADASVDVTMNIIDQFDQLFPAKTE